MKKQTHYANPEYVREAMRQWTSGVTIVSTAVENRQHGMTVSSFTSVSLVPPIIMVSLQNESRTHLMIKQSGVFGVTVLEASQRLISERFAGRTPDDEDRFADLQFFRMLTGSPFIDGGIAYLDCLVRRSIEMGGHTVYFGGVAASKLNLPGSPLLYHDRRYHTIGNDLNRMDGG